MRRPLLLFLLIVSSSALHAQNQSLRLARSVYEQGRLQEIPSILTEKLINDLTIEEKVEAYKLLCLTNIYLEEPEEADKYMLKILQTNHEFVLNRDADPAEFVALYETFRHDPIYRIGGKVQGILSRPNVVSTERLNNGDSEYTQRLGYGLQITAEIPLPWFNKRLTFNPELGIQSRSFVNTNTIEQDDFVGEGIERQNWITLPLSVQVHLFEFKKIQFYVSGGMAADYLLSSTITASKLRGDNNSALAEKSIDVKQDRNSFNSSLLLSAGGKTKVGKGYLIGEIRFQYGLTNNTDIGGTFSNQALTYEYQLVDSIFKLNSLNVSVGYVINVYKPKKLSK
jgi:Outer membrane protein beta-barrel domain